MPEAARRPSQSCKRWFGFDRSFGRSLGTLAGDPLQQASSKPRMRGEHLLGDSADRHRQVALLSDPRPVALRQDRRADGRHLAAGGADGRPGGGTRGTRGHLLRGDQRSCCRCPSAPTCSTAFAWATSASLIISPEQLAQPRAAKVLEQREIGAWVLDEAHCLSKWGHDFRPDYRYVGRFIQEKAGEGSVPPVLCLTATAKPDVVADILVHFRDQARHRAAACSTAARSRTNLEFAVVPTSPGEKFAHIHQILQADLPAGQRAAPSCTARRAGRPRTSREFLRDKGRLGGVLSRRLPPETKKSVQAQFIRGDLRVIVATNAFGMGIDKPDVRLVIHADIPGSLENYLQEAGRAGRDRQAARCVLLYTPEDVERQFGMSARSRLTRGNPGHPEVAAQPRPQEAHGGRGDRHGR